MPDDLLISNDSRQTLLKKKRFLMAYAKLGTVLKAAEVADIHRSTFEQEWMPKDSEFAELFKGVQKDYLDKLLGICDEQAPHVPNLLMFRIKGLAPEYRDNYQVQVNVSQPVRILDYGPGPQPSIDAEVAEIKELSNPQEPSEQP